MNKSEELKFWVEKVEKTANRLGLSFYQQEFYVIAKQKMIEMMAYHGGYPLYPHWSFGKSLKIGKILYEKNYFFLPYEIVINTNPCRAFLLESNPLFYNILVAAHVYGHNDFFKNNGVFKDTRPGWILEEMEKYRLKIRKFVNDRKIGIEKVEKTIDAAHAMMFIQTDVNFYDFLIENGTRLEPWQKETLAAVKIIDGHLRPNIRTKIINEGWATYWHWRIIEELKNSLSFDDYFKMRMAHLRVIRPPQNPKIMNPYRVGFLLWKKIAEESGEAAIFKIRKEFADFEFLLTYFNNNGDFIYVNFVKPGLESLAAEIARLTEEQRKAVMEMFGLVVGKDGNLAVLPEQRELQVLECRDKILESRGENMMPRFEISLEAGKLMKEDFLNLKHKYDGRPLDIRESLEVLKLIQALWRDPVVLETSS
ncbi:MAG: SpoVR family protein, partial [Patescibacteria group bacterium]